MQVERTRMYRVKAVAEMLDVSVSTVYRAIESGQLDAYKIGSGKGALRVPGHAVATWLTGCAQAAYSQLAESDQQVVDTDSAHTAAAEEVA